VAFAPQSLSEISGSSAALRAMAVRAPSSRLLTMALVLLALLVVAGHVRPDLKEIGWTKAAELVKVARSDGQDFESAIWLHKARNMATKQFKCEVEKHLTGKDTEPYELVTFKLYKSQLPVVEQALETASLMLGTEKSRGYCLEMICADFLAGGNVDGSTPEVNLITLCAECHASTHGIQRRR
jgi:hypothetical protein